MRQWQTEQALGEDQNFSFTSIWFDMSTGWLNTYVKSFGYRNPKFTWILWDGNITFGIITKTTEFKAMIVDKIISERLYMEREKK